MSFSLTPTPLSDGRCVVRGHRKAHYPDTRRHPAGGIQRLGRGRGRRRGHGASSESGVDIILNHRLTETGFGSKKDYIVYLKDYMKKVVKYLEDNDRAGEVDTFKKNINGVMKDLLAKFKDLSFYTGESMDADAMILILDYREVDGEEKPVFLAFKHGITEEKY